MPAVGGHDYGLGDHLELSRGETELQGGPRVEDRKGVNDMVAGINDLQCEEEANAETERDSGKEHEGFPVAVKGPFLEDDFDTITTKV